MEKSTNNKKSAITKTVTKEKGDIAKNELALYDAIVNHPYFITEIPKVRKKLKIIADGFSSAQGAYRWEKANTSNAVKLKNETKILLQTTTANLDLERYAFFFLYDYILSPFRVRNLLMDDIDSLSYKDKKDTIKNLTRKQEAVRVIKTGKDVAQNKFLFQPDTVYLEIQPDTSYRELSSAWKVVLETIKDIPKFSISKRDEVARKVWKLSQEKYTHNEIAKMVNKYFGTKLGYTDIAIYKKRYKDVLDKIKPLQEQK